MRAMDEALLSPHPLGHLLPGIYFEDGFIQRFTQGLDSVFSSLLSTLDNLESYFDPDLSPADFIDWLSGWVGLAGEPADTVEARREMIKRAVEIYRLRGTVQGLTEHIALAFGITPEIRETGGVSTSTTSRSALPGSEEAELVVILRVPDPASFNRSALDGFVRANKPAHLPHRIEVLAPGETAGKSSRGGPQTPSPARGDGKGDGRLPETRRSAYRGYGPVRRGDE
ncbi:MAG: phage tail protein [Actinomycetota bacterium]